MEISGHGSGMDERCPDRGTPSLPCHSHYERMLSDLPISGAIVKLRLNVHRFRCNPHSRRRTTFREALVPNIGR